MDPTHDTPHIPAPPPSPDRPQRPAADSTRAQRLALAGLLTNFALTIIKLVAGYVGNSYALIADAIESLTDIVGSAVIWGGLRISARPASDRHPYGYGKAESLAAAAVALLVLLAGIGIAIEAIFEIITPHHTPKPFTLAVLAGTVLIKETMFRAVRRAARDTGSAAVETDAWHHRADAITSAAAFIGISIAVIGKQLTSSDTRFAPADDWAALFAALIIFYNASRLIIAPIRELLDVQSQPTVDQARATAAKVPGVVHVQKAFSRKSGTRYWLDMHVWVDPHMTVQDAHTLAHAIKDAVRANNPRVIDVLIHVEPARPQPPSPPTQPTENPPKFV